MGHLPTHATVWWKPEVGRLIRMTTIDLHPTKPPNVCTILFALTHMDGDMQYLVELDNHSGERTTAKVNNSTGRLDYWLVGGVFVKFIANLVLGTSHSSFLEYADDDFLKTIRDNWHDSETPFNQWVGRIAGTYRGILKKEEIERLMSLQTFG